MYHATVPVFRQYLGQVARIADVAGPEALNAQVGDTFPAGQQFATAAGFALRIACPLAGREVPELPRALAPRLAVVQAVLRGMALADFDEAEDRVIRHRAGFADLEQSGREFLYLFGLPNFFFHVTMGYAALRGAGVPLGKADFDGLHHYPADFRFT